MSHVFPLALFVLGPITNVPRLPLCIVCTWANHQCPTPSPSHCSHALSFALFPRPLLCIVPTPSLAHPQAVARRHVELLEDDIGAEQPPPAGCGSGGRGGAHAYAATRAAPISPASAIDGATEGSSGGHVACAASAPPLGHSANAGTALSHPQPPSAVPNRVREERESVSPVVALDAVTPSRTHRRSGSGRPLSLGIDHPLQKSSHFVQGRRE